MTVLDVNYTSRASESEAPPHAPPPSREPPHAARTNDALFALAFAVATVVAFALARRTGLVAFSALGTLGAWAALVALVALLPARLPFRLREILLALGLAAIASAAIWFHRPHSGAFGGATDALLQLAAVVFAIGAFGFHFLATYGAHVIRAHASATLAALVPLARLLAAAHALFVAALLAQLYAQRNGLPALTATFEITAGVLAVEALLHALARFYQPPHLRNTHIVFGRSVLLPTLFGEAGPLRSLAATLEKTFGVRLADTWLVRLARTLAAPLALAGLLGVWASTAITSVPVDSRGVLVERGAFAETPLAPGLHAHAPWPFARVVTVPTERVQELSLGFERDLSGPVLWAEKHFEGEQNLLVGQGEELLTINVPIHYRVRDAVAFLRRAGDARAALAALGYRELLALTATHTSFGLMTTDRAEVAENLRAGLQAASDRLGLGLEIVFVGLKDVHPPVPVAPAYQDVISAEEQRSALADHARTYAVQALAAAAVSAQQIRTQADAAATARRARAAGEAARFLAPLPAYRAHPDVFTVRVRLEALESALAGVRSLVLVPAAARTRTNFFLGLDGAALVPTATR